MAKVLIIGGGGREHALAWALSRSPHVTQVYVTGGNGGTTWPAQSGAGLLPHAPCENVAVALGDVVAWAEANQIDLTVVGPEGPLAEGIVDAFQERGLPIFGPTQAAAQIEASKTFAKDLMTERGIPTAEYFVTDDVMAARRYVTDHPQPLVIKADGLAAGKGVIVTENQQEAGMAIHRILTEVAFGEAGESILIEERLYGREASVLAFCDGRTVRPMVVARDHKRIFDGERGPNTGGMGAIAPADDVSAALIAEVVRDAIQPAIEGLAALGSPYVGVLYAGVMFTERGMKVLEFNARFGDPETQAILPLLKSDLYEVMQTCIQGRLDEIELEWHAGYSASVVVASRGYPDTYPKGVPIHIEALGADIIAFHAGTKRTANGDLVTDGGRVLAITARGVTLEEALALAYSGVERVRFDGMQFRRDIGA